MPKRKLPPNEEIISLYRSGISSGEIAERFSVSPVTVISLLSRIGEPRRSAGEAAGIRSESGRSNSPKYWEGKKQPVEMIEKRISKIRGENHWLWKGGKDRRKYRGIKKKESCELCGAKINLGFHHKDFDYYNDNPENLEILCNSCHISLHKKAYWESIRTRKGPKRSNGPVGWR